MKSIDAVGYIVKHSVSLGRPANNLRVQVLLYMVQQEVLLDNGAKPFDDFAPKQGILMFPEVYHKLCYYCDFPIVDHPLSANVTEGMSKAIYSVVKEYLRCPTWKLIDNIATPVDLSSVYKSNT